MMQGMEGKRGKNRVSASKELVCYDFSTLFKSLTSGTWDLGLNEDQPV